MIEILSGGNGVICLLWGVVPVLIPSSPCPRHAVFSVLAEWVLKIESYYNQ